MNPFDAFVVGVALLAIVMGFRSGLLRSLATILGYLIAAPLALEVAPRLIPLTFGVAPLSPEKTWMALFGIFIVVGLIVSALLRAVVNGFIGDDAGLFDRVAGAALGAVRIFLVAVLVVVIFDRIIPAGQDPQFLAGSRLRPWLSAAGQKGLQSLPPEVEDYIDRLKRERGL